MIEIEGPTSEKAAVKQEGTAMFNIRNEKEERINITLDQEEYIRDMLFRFKMEDCKSVSTPMAVKNKQYKEDERLFEDEKLYKQLIGSLIYLSNATRPDI